MQSHDSEERHSYEDYSSREVNFSSKNERKKPTKNMRSTHLNETAARTRGVITVCTTNAKQRWLRQRSHERRTWVPPDQRLSLIHI
eukprot:6179955-Pleurochrysis_carterae.AAC.4